VAIGYVAPLLGLLGTVTGLIQAFVQLSANSGYATLAEVSGGIYQSLLTTAGGLVVAIPTILAYCHLSARLNALLHEIERAGIEVVNLLSEAQSSSEIIQFGQAVPPATRERR
jgi:biopolymer transport protein ExbB